MCAIDLAPNPVISANDYCAHRSRPESKTVPMLVANSTPITHMKLPREWKWQTCVLRSSTPLAPQLTLMTTQAQYLEHLADDSATHWVRGQPEESADEELKRFRGVLNQDYCALFRPRLDAFFDMRLPMDEDKRNGEDKVLSESEYSLFVEERHQRIKYIESAVAVAVSWKNLGLQRMVGAHVVEETDACRVVSGAGSSWKTSNTA